MTDDKDSFPVQRLEVVQTGRRRRWTLEEELRIVMESVQGRRLAATARLGTVIRDLDIAPGDLRPMLAADLRRERFDITDKGRSWFKLDREIWSFRSVADPGCRVEFEDIVIDTRLKKHDPELIRRVMTMRRLARLARGVPAAGGVPHERAVERLGLDTRS